MSVGVWVVKVKMLSDAWHKKVVGEVLSIYSFI